jgi:CHAT domain-containing protein/tetratricopeptide (TPR) repeat protein
MLIVACLLTLPTALPAQELPKVTEEAKKAANDLLATALKAGALQVETDPRTKDKRLVVADERKLQEVAKQQRKQFTPALRDALLPFPNHPGIVALLLHLGQEVGDDRAVAFAQLFAAEALAEQLKYREARQSYQEAVRLFGQLNMGEWQVLALNNLGDVCKQQEDLAEARRLFQQVRELCEHLYGKRHPRYASSLNNLAMICRNQGDLTEARNLQVQALTLQKELYGERHPHVADSLNNLALVYRAQGDLPGAHKLLQQALDLRRQLFGERHPDVAQSLNNLGLVCEAEGDLPRARQLQQQALDLRRQLLGERHPLVAQSLDHLSGILVLQGDLPQARKLCEQALHLYKQVYGERHPDVAISLNNLALICKDQGDLPQARASLEQVLDLCQRLRGERHPEVANALNNLAAICRSQGDLLAAQEFGERALRLRRRLYGERHPAVAYSLSSLAWVYYGQGDLPRAARTNTEAVLACRLPPVKRDALADLRAGDLTCDAGTVQTLNNLGQILEAAGGGKDLDRAGQAARAYALAADLLDRLRADVLQSEEGKLFQGAELATLVPSRVRLAGTLFDLGGKGEDLRTAATAVEQGRARVFLEALARARSYQVGGVPQDRLRQERDLLGSIRALEGRIEKENGKILDQRDAGLVAKLFDELHAKRQKLDEFAAGLRKDYPQYAALQYPEPCTLREARDCLADNEVAVLFAVDRQVSYAVIVEKRPAPGDKGQGVAVVPLPGSDVLGPKVRTLVDDEVLKSDSRCRELGAELYDLLLRPLVAHVRGKDLVLVPDGVLWELPFELLVEGRTAEDDGKYLIESRLVRYTPSLTVLHLIGQWEEKREAPTEPLWALGDPVFSADDPRAKGDLHEQTRDLLERYALRGGGGGTSWKRLPATGDEVRAISRMEGVGKDDVVTDGLASEAVVKTASKDGILARKRYLHLATHGILGVGLGRQPSLVLSLVGNDGQEQLGGANDGFLTLEEVTHLKLNADLVVLSACETGKGDLRAGEGVIGLSRAFLYAGSRGVVCSLWSVDDARTAALMQTMYEQLQRGKPSAKALALARRRLIAQEQAPFYWAPFILIGK